MNIRSDIPEFALRQEIDRLKPWFQNLRIKGIETAPDHFLGDYPRFKWQGFSHVIPEDLTGWSVLDIGCNAGFYALEMKRRGAARVVGIDTDERYLSQARLAAQVEGRDIEFHRMSVYEIAELKEAFDLVIFMGVLYHLRHPLLALDLIKEHAAGRHMLFQCLQRGWDTVPEIERDYPFSEWSIFDKPDFPALYMIEHSYAGDPTNWFIPNRAGVEALLRSAGFSIENHPEREVYWCSVADPPTTQANGGG